MCKKGILKCLGVVIAFLSLFLMKPITCFAFEGVQVWTADSLEKIDMTREKRSTDAERLDFISVRNEFVTGQVLIRSSEDLHIQSIKFSDLESSNDTISSDHFKYNYGLFQLDEKPDPKWVWGDANLDYLYPPSVFVEPLSNDKSMDIVKEQTQPIYITVYIPKDAVAGDYNGLVTLKTDLGDIEVDLDVEVYDVTIPDASDSDYTVYNWEHSAEQNIHSLYYDVDKYSSQWWEVMSNFARTMAENRQNMFFVPTVQLLLDGGTTIDEEGTIHFDWTYFDQFVETFRDQGVNRIGGQHLALHWNGVWGSTYSGEQIIRLARKNDGSVYFTGGEIPSEEANNWFDQFLPALKVHLDEKGWTQDYVQHLYDEPSTMSKWVYLRNKVNTHMPGVRTIDADNHGGMIPEKELVDIWCPQEDVYVNNKDFYDTENKNGEDVWNYVCCAPGFPYLNRFTFQPNLSAQLLYWYGFKNNLDGYLHWGWNNWVHGYPQDHQAGDTYIVYPDREHLTVMSSPRLIAQRDGIEDLEKLKILSASNPGLATELVDCLVSSAVEYEHDWRYARQIMNLLVQASAGEDILIPTKEEPELSLDEESLIYNHDFEMGDLSGWEIVSGDAFTDKDVTETIYWGKASHTNYGLFNQQGGYHLWGYRYGGDGEVGVIKSNTFTLGERNQIEFLISGGNNIDKLYVALVRESDGYELLKATGKNSEEYFQVIWDASPYKDIPCYIKVVDKATGGWGHINLDNVTMNKGATVTGFEDNFDDGDLQEWTVNSGQWRSTGITVEGTASSMKDVFLLRSEVGTDFTFQADIRLVDSDAAGMLVFRSNSDASHSYCINIDGYHDYIKLFKFPYEEIDTYDFQVESDVWYHLKVEIVENNIKVYFENQELPIISIEDSAYSNGIFGIGAWNGKVEFDNVLMEQ